MDIPIPDLIEKEIIENSDFCDSIGQKDTIINYFKADTYFKKSDYARELIETISIRHNKLFINPTLQILHNLEIYEEYDYDQKQKYHFIHTLNVYLLGLYIYSYFTPIRRAIENEITKTEQDNLQKSPNPKRDYSQGSIKGEFLYRWRFASLPHDIGYGVSLYGNENEKISRYLRRIGSCVDKEIPDIERLFFYYSKIDQKSILDSLNSRISEIDLLRYLYENQQNPLYGKIFYDHGIISALIFLLLINESFDKNNINRQRRGRWNPDNLRGALSQSARAIALHNITQNSILFEKNVKNRNKKKSTIQILVL